MQRRCQQNDNSPPRPVFSRPLSSLVVRTKEMMQPCMSYLRVISLVRPFRRPSLHHVLGRLCAFAFKPPVGRWCCWSSIGRSRSSSSSGETATKGGLSCSTTVPFASETPPFLLWPQRAPSSGDVRPAPAALAGHHGSASAQPKRWHTGRLDRADHHSLWPHLSGVPFFHHPRGENTAFAFVLCVSLSSRPRHCLCRVCSTALRGQPRNCLCPVRCHCPSRPRHCLCLVCFHCLRGQDTAFQSTKACLFLRSYTR